MKHALLAVPTVALFTIGAFAQTDTTGTATGAVAEIETSGESFATNWPLSVGATFFTDAESNMLRSTDEITGGWQSFSQEDRDMIEADCVTFMAAHGDTSADAATGSDASSGTAPAASEGTIAAAVGYDMSEIKAICEAVATL